MKFFQKILIGLCSLLPCFASVPPGSRGKTREIQKRNYQAENIFQIDQPCDLKYLPSSACTSTINSVRSSVEFSKGGVSLGFQPSPDRVTYGCSFSINDVVPFYHAFGFLLYSPLFDGVNQYVNQYQVYFTGYRPVWKPATYTKLDNYVFCFIDNDKEIEVSRPIHFRFTLSNAYSSVNKEKGWYYVLPFLIKDTILPDTLSAVGYGLYQGFLAGLSYSKPHEQFQYQDGFKDGEASGLKKGYSQGYEAGKAVADQAIYKNGYDKGYSDGSSTLTPASTIWGLFGAIASVPTEILNGMGSIAIWNTPILAILFSLLFLALVLWIVRKFI